MCKNRYILFIIVFCCLQSFLAYSGIAVSNPKGGDVYNVGEQVSIEFQASSDIQTVGISFSVDGGRKYQNIIRSMANKSPYIWTIPISLTGSDKCVIAVFDAVKTTTAGKSGIFSIHNSNTLSIIHPNGGEIVPQSPPVYYIYWDKQAAGTNVKIELWKGVQGKDGIFYTWYKDLASNATNNGRFQWNVIEPAYQYYKIKIIDIRMPSVYAISDNPFEIKAGAQSKTSSNSSSSSGSANPNLIKSGSSNKNFESDQTLGGSNSAKNSTKNSQGYKSTVKSPAPTPTPKQKLKTKH